MRTAITRARTAPRASRRPGARLAMVAIGMLLAAAAPAYAIASSRSRPVVIHVRDLAHYRLSYVRKVQTAVQFQVNHQLHPIWRTPLVRFDAPSTRAGPSTGWLVDVTPRATVMYGFFTRANGFHLPDSPVYIDIAGRAKTMPMSLILSHEVIEALVDPGGDRMTGGMLTEVCDSVEQPGYQVDGITVSNFVTPRWFTKAAGEGPFDAEGLLAAPLTVTAQGFMPGNASANSEASRRTVALRSAIRYLQRQGSRPPRVPGDRGGADAKPPSARPRGVS